MATSTNQSRVFPARSRKSYRLEMESRTLYWMLGLMALTGVVVFYLGVETGKALRDPNAPVALSAEIRSPAIGAASQAEGSKKAFNNALEPNNSLVEGLRNDQNQATLRTETLMKQSNLLKLEEVLPAEPSQRKMLPVKKPAAPATPSVAERMSVQPARKASAEPPAALTPLRDLTVRNPTVQSPAPVPPAVTVRKPARARIADDGSLYTIQVFSSRYQKNAQDLVDRLKNKGFPAYINRFQKADNQVFFRVRVGKTNKPRAMDLSDRLKREALMRNPQLTKL